MTKEQTNSWEEEVDDMFVVGNVRFEGLANNKLTPKNLKQFISKTIYQEKEKWYETVKEVIGKCTPLYLEGESKDFTEGQEYTIKQFQKYFNILNK